MRSSAPAQKRSPTPRGSRSACGCLSTCPLSGRYRQPEPSSGTDRTTASRSATKTVVGSRSGSVPNRIEPTEWTTWTTGSMSTSAVPIADRLTKQNDDHRDSRRPGDRLHRQGREGQPVQHAPQLRQRRDSSRRQYDDRRVVPDQCRLLGWASPGESVVPGGYRVLLLGRHHNQEEFCDPYFIHVRRYRIRPCGPPR